MKLLRWLQVEDSFAARRRGARRRSAAKWAARVYARMFFALYACPVVLTRVFMVYGPVQRDTTKLVPYTINSLLRGEAPRFTRGTREIDWIYVDDVVEALLAAAQAPRVEGLTFDIGTGTLTPIRSVVESILRIVGSSSEPLFGSLPDRALEIVRSADIRQAERKLNWSPRVSLEDGLTRTVDWYRSQFQGALFRD